MDYSPWSSKNLITWNWLKKFVQVGVDVTCMYTDFGGHGLSSFGDNNFNVGVFLLQILLVSIIWTKLVPVVYHLR